MSILQSAARSGAALGRSVSEWHIITCEYPPQIGGVSSYVATVAACSWRGRRSCPCVVPGGGWSSS